MSRPRLILHIGSQKTGTTAIQGFLKSQQAELQDHGLHFLEAGRTNIAHNSVLRHINNGQAEAIAAEMVAEVQAQPDKCSVISSEMFFRPGFAQFFADHFPASLREETKVLVYLRRQDKYAEAMYKQRVKNGRYQGSPSEYAAEHVNLDYMLTLAQYALAFGHRNIIVRPFERSHFPGGDVLRDFASHASLSDELFDTYAASGANATLSREISEQLGVLNRSGQDVNTREIIRHIIRTNPPDAFRSGDCYSLVERLRIAVKYAASNDALRRAFCPELPELFDMSDLEDDRAYVLPDPIEKARRLRRAKAIVSASRAELDIAAMQD